MARPREFDEGQVLDRAVDLFWSKGYEATSVRDLEEATGLSRGSLYAAFGDKERLFLAVLDRYCERFTDPSFGGLAWATSPRAALAELFERLPDQLTRSQHPRGCLVASTCAESPVGSEAITRKAVGCLARMETALYGAVRRMQTLGELAPERDARTLARFLTGTVQGMAVIARVSEDSGMLRDIASTAINAIEPIGPSRGADAI